MSITNKFPYKEMSKVSVDGKRRYLTPDGLKVPSVTTILDSTKSEESKQALQNWRNSIGHKKAAEITTEAAGRGTRMHKWIENYIKDDVIGDPGSNPYSQTSHMMAKQIIEKGLVNCDEYWGTEVSLHFPEVYAGTTDLCGVHAGAEAIMDHKQSNKPKKREWIDDYFVQTAAYAIAHNEVFNTKIRKGVIFMCVPPTQAIDHTWSTPQYLEFIIEGNEFDKYENLWWKRLEAYYSKLV
jgi:genome maintenance exonuclease 1